MSFQRKKIRLPISRYVGKQIYFVALCCEDRRPIFRNESLGYWLVTELSRSAAKQSFAIHAYCVMPDHVHLLAEGMTETCDLVRFISLFKQKTAFYYKKKIGHGLWQSSYYDYILRKPEATDAVASYIWTNPVRKGLCSAPQDYSLSGSLTLDWRGRCSSVHTWLPPWKAPQKMPG